MPLQSLWMLFAAFMFAVMGVCVKLAGDWYSTSEIVAVRGAIGVAFMALWIFLRGGVWRTGVPWRHLWRGATGSIALWLWFFSIGKLPLATAMTFNYMSPIWIAAIVFCLAWRRGARQFEWGLGAAILAGFAGVALLLQPTVHAEQWLGALLAFLSGWLTALAYLEVRQLGVLGEPEYRVVFYFSLTGTVTGLIGMAFEHALGAPTPMAAAPAWQGVALLAGVGVCATIAQIAMTRAYRLGHVLLTANLQYAGIVFASLFGILVWDDVLAPVSWLGMAVILGSGMAATYYNARKTAIQAARPATSTPDPIATEV